MMNIVKYQKMKVLQKELSLRNFLESYFKVKL
jgi:hypothetical protein